MLYVPPHGAPLGTARCFPWSGRPAGGATTRRSHAVLPQETEIRLREKKQFLFNKCMSLYTSLFCISHYTLQTFPSGFSGRGVLTYTPWER